MSHTAQLTLLNSPISDEWDILAIQEPALNTLGNTRANTHWRVAYPDCKYSHGEKPRAVTLVSSKLSTNAWRQVPFLLKDIVIIQLDTSGGKCTIVNVYNDNNHDNTVEELERFLNANIQELHPSDEDHMVWLGNFNRHHPLWDEDRNNHLFTPVALEASNKLLEIVADHGMTQILPKDILTLQLSSTQNWTHPDNTFCTEHTSELLLTCNTEPEKQGPKTDHLPILTVFDMSMPASTELPTWNYQSVDWDKFNSSLKDSLTELSGNPRIIEMAEEFQQAAHNFDQALCRTVEAAVPRTWPHPHTKRWWTKDLTKTADELKQLRKTAHRYRALPEHEVHAQTHDKENMLSKEI